MREAMTTSLSCMAGTNAKRPHRTALQQSPDGGYACLVYEQRPDPCREVRIGDDKCLQARARHALPALQQTRA